MADATSSVDAPKATPAAVATDPPAPRTPPGGWAAGPGGSIAAAFVVLHLLACAVETFLAGSSIRWTVMGFEVVALALLWTRTGPTIRLAMKSGQLMLD